MAVIDEIQGIISDKGDKLTRADLDTINILAVDVPLEDTEQVGMIFEAIALIVNDPLYEGDIPPLG